MNHHIAKHWLVAIDLSKMDDILIGYTSFLASVIKPATITFLHIIESVAEVRKIVERFPELESREALDHLLSSEIHEKAAGKFDDPSIELKVVIREGYPSDKMINIVNTLEPDLLIMGRKSSFVGEGVLPKQTRKYVPASILFVPENCRYQLKNALVPVDFSEQSADGVKVAQSLVKDRVVSSLGEGSGRPGDGQGDTGLADAGPEPAAPKPVGQKEGM